MLEVSPEPHACSRVAQKTQRQGGKRGRAGQGERFQACRPCLKSPRRSRLSQVDLGRTWQGAIRCVASAGCPATFSMDRVFAHGRLQNAHHHQHCAGVGYGTVGLFVWDMPPGLHAGRRPVLGLRHAA